MIVPEHIAIIMDGNGRWAEKRGWKRIRGHRYGVKAVQRTVRAAYEAGVRYLTLYAFSTENWKRPKKEVEMLFSLMQSFAEEHLKQLHREGVFIKVIGQREGLSERTLELVKKVEETTKNNNKFFLSLAINYGGRNDILRAIQKIMQEKSTKEILLEEDFSEYLDNSDWPDPDLLIRTSGEYRLSNFLIWQCAYTEFIFMDVLWPDFDKNYLKEALEEFSGRARRFGEVKK